MLRVISLVLAALLLLESSAFAGIPKKSSMYVGGTVSAIPLKTTAPLNVDGESAAVFAWKGGTWSVPYTSVTALSYGQHSGRRVGATVALGVTTLGIGALPMLFSKKRRHYLTIEFTDSDGKPQAAIFEVGKEAVRSTLKVLEVRSGKTIAYEDDEAKKAGNK
jgi:hypothetical protein